MLSICIPSNSCFFKHNSLESKGIEHYDAIWATVGSRTAMETKGIENMLEVSDPCPSTIEETKRISIVHKREGHQYLINAAFRLKRSSENLYHAVASYRVYDSD